MRLWVFALLAALVLAGTAKAVDQDGDGIEEADEQVLLDTYAPHLSPTTDERYFPTSVDHAFDNSVLELWVANGTTQLLDPAPTSSSIALYTDPTAPIYLNNTHGTTLDDDGILDAYRTGSYPKTVYGHVVDDGGNTVVQYWFYYAYNPGTWNNHEGDWEMIEVLLSGSSPVNVAYSQHHDGERMAWSDADKVGSQPKVYVARGSHANYLRAYEGRIGIEGDAVSDAGTHWQPSDYTIVNVGELNSPLAGSEWLRFAGRWGEWYPQIEARGEGGPNGPAYREGGDLFTQPVTWANERRVPDGTFLLLNWFLANLLLLFLLLVLLFAVIKVLLLWRLHRKTKAGVKMWPYAHLRPFDRKSAGMLLAVVGLVLGIVGFLLPWYVVTADINAPGFLVTNGPVNFITMDGLNGLTVNPMKPNGDLVQVNMLPLPLGLMLFVTSLTFFLRVAGTKTSRRLGARFVIKGIVAILPFILVVLIMALVLPAFGGGNPNPTEPQDYFGVLVGPMKQSPFGGSSSTTIGGSGTVSLRWGLGIGAWLMVASAVVLFIAGALCLAQRYSFLPQWYVDGFKTPEEAAAAQAGAPAAAMAPLPGAPAPVAPTPPTAPAVPPMAAQLASVQAPIATAPATSAPPVDAETRLRKLQELKDRGLISPDVYEAKRAEIVSQTAPPGPAAMLAPSGPPTTAPPTSSCGQCGAPLEAGARFCGKCGRPTP